MSKDIWTTNRFKTIVNHYGEHFFKGKKILDVGAGKGLISFALADLGATVTALDVRKNYLDIIKGRNPAIRVVRADLDQQWPFATERFDVIICLSTLNHLQQYERCLNNITSITDHAVIDMQVCDSADANKVSFIKENRGNGIHSFNGIGCRPSVAHMERLFYKLGLECDSITDERCNGEGFFYDWVERNTNTYVNGQSRFWFLRRTHKEIVSPRPRPQEPPPVFNNDPKAKIVREESPQDMVRESSRSAALIYAENFPAPTFDIGGVVFPVSLSSRMWMKKIIPFFPNVKPHVLTHTMMGFKKSNAEMDVIMCSVRNLYSHKRIWIEEWSDYELTNDDLGVLMKCQAILTPSILNANTIRTALPTADVQVVSRPWPALPIHKISNNFLYFEKYASCTKLLLSAWDDKFGEIKIVGPSVKLPSFATYVSDSESFVKINGMIAGAKAIIDLTSNACYESGIGGLAKALGTPIITNNQFLYGSHRHVLISQDKTISAMPTASDINQAITRFNKLPSTRTATDTSHNDAVLADITKILGK